jgi:hypothetical protein
MMMRALFSQRGMVLKHEIQHSKDMEWEGPKRLRLVVAILEEALGMLLPLRHSWNRWELIPSYLACEA